MGVQYLEAYRASKLIVNQIKREYEVHHEDLIPYHQTAIKLANTFDGFYISHVSCLENMKVDTLSALAPMLALPANTSYRLTMTTRQLFSPKYSLKVNEVYATLVNFKPRDWRLINVILYEYFISCYAYFFHFNVALVVLFVTFADLESKSCFGENTDKIVKNNSCRNDRLNCRRSR